MAQVRRQEISRHRRASQKVQRVFILRHLLRETRGSYARRIHFLLRTMNVQFRNEPSFVTQPDQVVDALPCFKGGLRQLEVLPVCRQHQIGSGHFRHQQNLCTVASLLRRQVLLQRPIREALDAAEEVDFPCQDAEAGIVLVLHYPLFEARQIGGDPSSAHAAAGIDHRQQSGSLNAVQGPCPLYIQGGYPQIAVVRPG